MAHRLRFARQDRNLATSPSEHALAVSQVSSGAYMLKQVTQVAVHTASATLTTTNTYPASNKREPFFHFAAVPRQELKAQRIASHWPCAPIHGQRRSHKLRYWHRLLLAY